LPDKKPGFLVAYERHSELNSAKAWKETRFVLSSLAELLCNAGGLGLQAPENGFLNDVFADRL